MLDKLTSLSKLNIFSQIGRPLFLLILLFIEVLIKVLSLIKLPKILVNKFTVSIITILFIVFIAGYAYFLNFLYSLPSPEILSSRTIEVSTKILDRNGILLYSLYKDKNRSLVDFEEIPQHIILATLAAEDSNFYDHNGFSIKGISRAIYKYFDNGKITGGSTITQQLVKNAILTPEKTLIRKIKEVIIALGVEHKFSKDEIITMYLNEIPYGGTAYGIKEAARVYFGKQLTNLTIAEAALLSGITKSPTLYSPFGNNPELAKRRQEEILLEMKENGFITDEQYEKEKAREIKYADNKQDIKAPHFVMLVKDRINPTGEDVVTTLDYKLQKLLENEITQEVTKLKNLNVTNGAGLIIDVKTGEVLAMVGSVNYFDIANSGNVNVTVRLRQPGSSIKPINYAYALEHGYTPASIIDDSPISFKSQGQPDYIPKNYDGKFRGKITLRSALAESRNIPAVKVLNSYGVNNMINLAKDLGITTWNEKNTYGLSLTLGGGAVKLTDLAQAYQTIANNGLKVNLTTLKNECSKNCSNQVIPDYVAFQLTNILSDNKARIPAFGEYSTLVIKDHPEVAVKTGTSNDLRDNLTIGYNQDYLVAIWVGNNDNSPMSRVASGITGASSIWNKVMTQLLKDNQSIAWTVPNDLKKVSVCGPTGRFEEWLLEGNSVDNCNIKTAGKDEKKNKRLN